ncbi:MAG: RagB/SusD family nutrient uptake outer membrane protein [Gemmatimonadales bacterium]
MSLLSRVRVVAVVALAGAGSTACDNFLSVETPSVIDADRFDPAKDPTLLSLSARQNFATATGQVAMLGGWLVWESWNGNAVVEYEQFGLRSVSPSNGVLNSLVWAPLSLALRSADDAVTTLSAASGTRIDVERARAGLYAGFALVQMADLFCQVVINGGPALTQVNALDSAVVRFTGAIAAAGPLTGNADAAIAGWAREIVNAAHVGRARAHLQAGRLPAAATDAQQVAAGFVSVLQYADNPAARVRLSNTLYRFTADSRTIVVPPGFRVSDPRVAWLPANGQTALDGVLPFDRQDKYRSYAAPIRLASKIEAEYIAAEASGTPAMLALVQRERAANGQAVYDGATDAASVLREFLDQRGREFYLEAKRNGDVRRHPTAVPHLPEAGTAYYKAGFTPVGNQICLPLPVAETANNPNFP